MKNNCRAPLISNKSDGTSYARVNNADKSFNETTYFADGKLASEKITLANGSGSRVFMQAANDTCWRISV